MNYDYQTKESLWVALQEAESQLEAQRHKLVQLTAKVEALGAAMEAIEEEKRHATPSGLVLMSSITERINRPLP